MAFLFARKLDPKRGLDGAAQYAKNMCAAWIFVLVSLIGALVLLSFGVTVRRLLGPNRLIYDIFAICGIILASLVMKWYFSRRKELYAPEAVLEAAGQMPLGRRVFVVSVAIATAVAFVVLGILEYHG